MLKHSRASNSGEFSPLLKGQDRGLLAEPEAVDRGQLVEQRLDRTQPLANHRPAGGERESERKRETGRFLAQRTCRWFPLAKPNEKPEGEEGTAGLSIQGSEEERAQN